MYSIAISDCPNDLFMSFFLPKNTFQIIYSTNEELNKQAKENKFDIIKTSTPLACKIQDYSIIDSGNSFTLSPGPLLIISNSNQLYLPSQYSTASFLYQLYLNSTRKNQHLKKKTINFAYTKKIEEYIDKGDSGVLIHHGANSIRRQEEGSIDLGAYYCKKFSMPLPLALLLCRKELPLKKIEKVIYESMIKSLRNKDYVIDQISNGYKHSSNCEEFNNREKEQLNALKAGMKKNNENTPQSHTTEYVRDFIDTYVTSISYELNTIGYRSIRFFLKLQSLLRSFR